MNREKSIKQQLVKYGRRIAQAGFVIGSGGNISVRYKNLIFLKAKDVNMADAKEDDYFAISLKTGRSKSKRRLDLPTSEYRMHILCYQSRVDVCAVVHAHPVYCVTLSSKIKVLNSPDYEFTAFTDGGRIRVIPYIQSGTLKLAQQVHKVIKQDNAVILRDHGLVCVGRNLEEAYIRCQAIEKASLIYILRAGLLNR